MQIFENSEKQQKPLDLFLSHYFRENPSLGSHDRRSIYDKVYLIIRWRGLIDYFCEKPITWEKRIAFIKDFDPLKKMKDTSIPDHIRVSFPKNYFDLIANAYGIETALAIGQVSNEQAPTTLRVNPLKITRSQLIDHLIEKGLPVRETPQSSLGIHCQKRENFFSLEEFKLGYFEVQDEGSQLISLLVNPSPGDQVLDYCAGSGGKTLAFAWKMEGKGQIYLHDVRETAFIQAKKRLNRAGIQNYQFLPPDSPKEKRLKRMMDWILLDVPCSGSGTLRRNPEMKWKFTAEDLEELVRKQREIFHASFPYGKKGCKIVYATCSLFPQENQNQVQYFLDNFPLKLLEQKFWLPQSEGMDGFFGALFEKVE